MPSGARIVVSRSSAGDYGSRDAVMDLLSGNASASAIVAQFVPAAEIH